MIIQVSLSCSETARPRCQFQSTPTKFRSRGVFWKIYCRTEADKGMRMLDMSKNIAGNRFSG